MMDGRYEHRAAEAFHPLHPRRNPVLWIAVIVPILGLVGAELDLRYAHKDSILMAHVQDSITLAVLRQDMQQHAAQIDALQRQVNVLDDRVHQLICSVKITEGCR